MNQQQIRYLDKRIQDMHNGFCARIDCFEKDKKAFLEQYKKKLLKDYERIVSGLDKRELVSRLVSLAEGKLNDGSYSYHWLMNEDTSDRNLWEAMDIDGFIKAHKERYDAEYKKFLSKNDTLKKELDEAVVRLRDRINLGEAEEALKTLAEFSDKWEKTISALESKS